MRADRATAADDEQPVVVAVGLVAALEPEQDRQLARGQREQIVELGSRQLGIADQRCPPARRPAGIHTRRRASPTCEITTPSRVARAS